ncbi:unnamed protein product [Orchesella dallaii]|uniref:Uncharacterized protein n=1 Tax=Orchesella dallaii TaxID=48710 RepID=A0ABP1PUF4_9HEXA
MSSQKLAFIAVVVCLPVGLPFPIQLEDNCFINFVGTGIQTESLTPFMNTFPAEATYTFSVRSFYSNHDDEEQLYRSIENITLQESYFRHTVKLRGSCITFILNTSTFNETVAAIHHSGFKTSDEVLFFVHLRTLAEWKDHISKFSALHEHSSFIFHANVIFIGLNSSYVGVHCYFCPPNPNRLHLIQLNSSSSYFHLKRFARQLNSQGHGRHVVVNSAIGDLNMDKCAKIDQYHTNPNRREFYHHIRKHCSPPGTVIYLPSQHVLNMTVVTHERDVPEHELDDLEWYTSLRYGETFLQRVPIEIVHTRGSILIMQNYKITLVTCVTIQSFSQNINYIFVSVIHGSTWVALGTVLLAYAMFYKSISRGIDIMWPLFSQPCYFNHPRKIVCLHWICMVFVSSIYASNISSESLILSDFPPVATLLKKGYKLWVPDRLRVFKLAGKYEKEIILDFFNILIGKNILGNGDYEMRFKKLYDLGYDGNSSLGVIHYIPLRNMSKLIDDLTTLKLFTLSPMVVRSLGKAAATNGLVYIRDTQLCKVFNSNRANAKLTLRLWSYMSQRASYVLSRFLEVGIPTKFEKLQIDLQQQSTLKVTETGACLPPKPLKLKSAVGVSVIVVFVVGTFLMLITFIGYLPVVYIRVSNFTRKIIERTRRRFRDSHVIMVFTNPT